ncbi:MAG TPA: hypothetical protein VHM66_13740, partial [Solirubrobacterales bacterium]|nr:hypothetical protein [Solirubrobacterales bacterium]
MEGWRQKPAGIAIGGLLGADQVDLAQRRQRPFGEPRPEVVAQRLVAGIADRHHGGARPEWADFGRGVAEVLPLQARQPVDLEREDERAEAKHSRQRKARP